MIILTAASALATDRAAALEANGAVVRAADSLPQALARLSEWDVSSVLVEGGARVHAAFWQARLVDRLHLIISPCTLGDAGVPLFDGYPVARSALHLVMVEPRGADIWIEADVHRDR